VPPETARAEPTLAQKVAHLSRPESYGEGTSAVEMIETHMSYVFLTDSYVYKLKKPVRHPFLDFSTLQARRFNCDEELRLNRRLARNVYLAVIALTLGAEGLQIDGPGTAVEWLVKMRRLPRHLMLDRAIQERRLNENDVARFTRVLAAFYRDAPRVSMTPSDYCARLTHAVLDDRRALASPDYSLDGGVLDRIVERLLGFLDERKALLRERVEKHMIVEGHGDLRPEHVCLAAEPVFIDCLEFNRDLRIVDPGDELGYLAMECELLGADYVRHAVFATYRECTGDAVDDSLISFYQAHRALLRAKLAAWHLKDGLTDRGREAWLARARQYLHLAETHTNVRAAS
jgi:aminoglycoside phosphotransferase family enzyme